MRLTLLLGNHLFSFDSLSIKRKSIFDFSTFIGQTVDVLSLSVTANTAGGTLFCTGRGTVMTELASWLSGLQPATWAGDTEEGLVSGSWTPFSTGSGGTLPDRDCFTAS